MNSPLRRLAPMLVGMILVAGTAGCGSPQATHHSAQIGRFYGEGISFSVPLVARAEKPGGEDRYWEVRRGIDRTVVVAFSPLGGGREAGDFRESMVVTYQDLDRDLTPAGFREAQAREIQQEAGLAGPATPGEDGAGPWLEFSREERGQGVRCRAWFFTRPAGPDGKARGYVLLGTAKAGPTSDASLATMASIAATFRFGRPPTGFHLLGQAVDSLAAALGSGTPSATPVPEAPASPETPAPPSPPAASPATPGAEAPAPAPPSPAAPSAPAPASPAP